MTPDFAAGPSATIDITIIPTFGPRASRSASGTATGCRASTEPARAISPSSSSCGTIRSMVATGMTSTSPRDPRVDIPSRAPFASSTAPPSSVRLSRISRLMRCSIRPPARLYHWGPTELTTPSRAFASPSTSLPMANASAPTRATLGVASTRRQRSSHLAARAGSCPDRGRRRVRLAISPCAVTTSYSIAPADRLLGRDHDIACQACRSHADEPGCESPRPGAPPRPCASRLHSKAHSDLRCGAHRILR